MAVQYALQRRHDERASTAPPFFVMIMVRFLAASGVSSLLDRSEQEWGEGFGRNLAKRWIRWRLGLEADER
jgi:hypothetical protein